MSIFQAILDLIAKVFGGNTGGTGNTGDWAKIENPLPYVDPNQPMPPVIQVADLPITITPQGYEQPAQAWTTDQITSANPIPFETVQA